MITSNGNSAQDGAAASTHAETERTLLQIWSEVLNTEPIGIYDDFLGLGGDSLAAMRCINRIIASFDVEVPLDLFLIESANITRISSEIARIQLDAEQMVARENV
jgi:hypothetical protein